MCNSLIKPLIKKFRNQDIGAFVPLYDNFKKLINYYASKLSGEDSVSDLTVFFIELLYEIDLSRFKSDSSFAINKYIAVSIRNKYIFLSVQNVKLQKFAMQLFENNDSYLQSIDEQLAVGDAFSLLSVKQRMVLIYKYIYGYSDIEISCVLNITRQAVNGIKKRALKILKDYFLGD